jgi:hypothetical protein
MLKINIFWKIYSRTFFYFPSQNYFTFDKRILEFFWENFNISENNLIGVEVGNLASYYWTVDIYFYFYFLYADDSSNGLLFI